MFPSIQKDKETNSLTCSPFPAENTVEQRSQAGPNSSLAHFECPRDRPKISTKNFRRNSWSSVPSHTDNCEFKRLGVEEFSRHSAPPFYSGTFPSIISRNCEIPLLTELLDNTTTENAIVSGLLDLSLASDGSMSGISDTTAELLGAKVPLLDVTGDLSSEDDGQGESQKSIDLESSGQAGTYADVSQNLDDLEEPERLILRTSKQVRMERHSQLLGRLSSQSNNISGKNQVCH